MSLILRSVEESLPVPVDTSCLVGVRRTAYCVVRHTRCHGNHLSRPVRNNKLQHNCAYSRSLYNTRQNKAVSVDLCAHGIFCTPTSSHLFVFLCTVVLQFSLRNTTDYGFRRNIFNEGSCVTANHILLHCLREPDFAHINYYKLLRRRFKRLVSYILKAVDLRKCVCWLCVVWPLLLLKRLSKHRFSCA